MAAWPALAHEPWKDRRADAASLLSLAAPRVVALPLSNGQMLARDSQPARWEPQITHAARLRRALAAGAYSPRGAAGPGDTAIRGRPDLMCG